MEQDQFLRTSMPIPFLVFYLFTTELQQPKRFPNPYFRRDVSSWQLILTERQEQHQCSQPLSSSMFKETSEPCLRSKFFASKAWKKDSLGGIFLTLRWLETRGPVV